MPAARAGRLPDRPGCSRSTTTPRAGSAGTTSPPPAAAPPWVATTPPSPRFGQIFKVGVVRPERNIGLDIEGSYFLVEGLGSSPGAMCLDQQNTLKRSVRNTLIWTGAGPYPCLPLPTGF